MRSALVGATGFVGGNLLNTRSYTDAVGSQTSSELAGQHYDLVVFAAARAEKWRINQDPEQDRVHMRELRAVMGSFTTERLVLISTVDVYARPVEVDEETVIEIEGLHPYGLHRFELEQYARSIHPRTTVIRLPGLFGAGLKKNVIFDLLHNNNVDRIHRAGAFQYYNLARLADDIDRVLEADLQLVNFSSAPVRTDVMAKDALGIDFTNEPVGVVAGLYDVRSVHATTFGGDERYTHSRSEMLEDLKHYVHDVRQSD